MASRKPRVFFLTYYPPTPTMGGAMAYYRHFVERKDFELFVATDDRKVLDYNPSYPLLLFRSPAFLERLTKTRLFKWVHSYKHLFAGLFVPAEVVRAAEKFAPDLIFTIAGSWGWTTLMSRQLARHLRVPLVGSFNDWFDFSIIAHPCARPWIERRFRSFYRECDLAFCTSEGMREELGHHPNAHVLYPTGARIEPLVTNPIINKPAKAMVVAFAGNLSLWYGRMLQQLVEENTCVGGDIRFRIYGANASWSQDFDRYVRDEGIFRGHLPFDQLVEQLKDVDCLLLPMGFESECALVERTSFKTKFLDYLTLKKPIVVWGPDYCSAVKIAREFTSAEVCSSPDSRDCLATLSRLQENAGRRAQLVENAASMYTQRFHPDKIHNVLLTQCMRVLVRK